MFFSTDDTKCTETLCCARVGLPDAAFSWSTDGTDDTVSLTRIFFGRTQRAQRTQRMLVALALTLDD